MRINKVLSGVLLAGLVLAQSVRSEPATAVLAGGCFWCMESDFEKLPGVTEVISGFTGGTHPSPTYSGAHDGHYEAVLITYDTDVLDYQGILNHFWVNHDPFDARGQFCDKGHAYLAAIFVANDEQRQLAEASRDRVIGMFPEREVITPVLELGKFYPISGAESYHQDYYKKSALKYKYYRWSCGRDARLKAIWGDKATVD